VRWGRARLHGHASGREASPCGHRASWDTHLPRANIPAHHRATALALGRGSAVATTCDFDDHKDYAAESTATAKDPFCSSSPSLRRYRRPAAAKTSAQAGAFRARHQALRLIFKKHQKCCIWNEWQIEMIKFVCFIYFV
jgi:hypothetical protein